MYIFTQKKSFPFSVFFAIFCVSSCFAVPKEVVRLSETVNVKSGKVQVTSIVADETEMIYIELPKNLYVVEPWTNPNLQEKFYLHLLFLLLPPIPEHE